MYIFLEDKWLTKLLQSKMFLIRYYTMSKYDSQEFIMCCTQPEIMDSLLIEYISLYQVIHDYIK